MPLTMQSYTKYMVLPIKFANFAVIMRQQISTFYSRHPLALLLLLLAVTLLLSGAFADYATKGEPREALVAIEMLRSSNWILPVDGAGDIAYKPPLFHWIIALVSLPFGGVSEFTSRVPSMLGMLLMCAMTWKFVGGSKEPKKALLAFLITATSFEVFRAGVNCRVDMLLAALMASAMMLMYRGGARNYLLATLCMSGAVLTKGPVGVALPVFLWWLWRPTCKGKPFWTDTALALLMTLGSLLLPALWYIAAWHEGGDTFLRLALEENFGRMTGTMSYASHVNPWYYNLLMLLCGLLPWTLLLVLSLAKRPWRFVSKQRKGISTRQLFCWIAVVGILIFYTIPKSKRGVYLLPLYPFAALLIADYILWYSSRIARVTRGMIISGFTFLGLYLITYAVVWPIITNKRSDRHVAHEVERLTGDAPIYTFINSRMDRFYGVDFYLGTRMHSTLPSGQDERYRGVSYTPAMMRIPSDSCFYLVCTLTDVEEQGEALSRHLSAAGVTLTQVWQSSQKTRDMHRPLVLFKAIRK